MTIRSYNVTAVDNLGTSYSLASHYSENTSSYNPATRRVNLLTQNSHTWNNSRVTYWNRQEGSYPPNLYFGSITPPGFDQETIYNRARAKWYGKLRKGSASLGVTAASWAQSRDMIVSRSKKLGAALDHAIARAQRKQHILQQPNGRTRYFQSLVKGPKRKKEAVADAVLETEFGWRPLFSDLHAAMYTVCKDLPPSFITSRHREVIFQQIVSGGDPSTTQEWAGWARTTLSGSVILTNPNYALLNRLGLINPATVLWDLIPWSFVVNMFVNVNEMISSITDEVGYDVSNRSRTDTVFTLTSVTTRRPDQVGRGFSSAAVLRKQKTRTGVSQFAPSWQVKVPELNWELAIIASSLVVQKFKKLNRLLSL